MLIKKPRATPLVVFFLGSFYLATAQEKDSGQISVTPRVLEMIIGQQTYELWQVLSPPASGTFWSIRTNLPPIPFAPPGLDVFEWKDGTLFYDDTAFGYSQTSARDAFAQPSSENENGPPPPGEGEGGEDDPVESPPPYNYTTNDLWLEIVAVTNGLAYFMVHTPDTNAVDLFMTTNLTSTAPGLNLTNWLWVLRTAAPATNLTLTNLWPEENWFRLATLLDGDNDLLTSGYEILVSHTDPNNADTDQDGISDYWELQLGTNPNFNESTSFSSRLNFTYGTDGWLRTVSGAKSKALSLDPEANVLQVTP